jgi:hypothetical protein
MAQAVTRDHSRVGMGDFTLGRGKHDAMALHAQDTPGNPLSPLSQSVAEVKSSAKVPWPGRDSSAAIKAPLTSACASQRESRGPRSHNKSVSHHFALCNQPLHSRHD